MTDKLPVLVVDNTWVDGIRTCPRFAQYRFVEHLSPTLTAAPLNFGAAIHAGLAEIGRRDALGKAVGVEQVMELTNAAIAEVSSHFGLQETSETEWRTLDKACDVVRAYIA